MNRNHLWKLALVAPALAAMLAVGGCDNDDDDAATTGNTGAPPLDGMTVGGESSVGDDEATPAGTGMTLPEAAKDQLSQLTEDFQEAADAAKGEEGANETLLGQANEVADSLQEAFENGNLQDAGRYMSQLQGMKDQLPANLQTMLDNIMNAVPENVRSMMNTAGGAMNSMNEGADSLRGMMGGDEGDTGGSESFGDE